MKRKRERKKEKKRKKKNGKFELYKGVNIRMN